jgi:hypothetical protein
VSFFSDHPVATSAIVLGILVLPCLAFLALRGLAVLRAVKASKRAVEPQAERLMKRAEDVQAEVARLTERGVPELTSSIDGLRKRSVEVGVVARAASEGVGTLLAPLRYLGR